MWWNASVDRERFSAWRATAAEYQMCVDVLVSSLVELDLVVTDLLHIGGDPETALRAALAVEPHIHRLGPAGALRDWLTAPPGVDVLDELPELVLPERLVARLTPGTSLGAHVRLDRVALALACDQRAAAHGRTLESWALHAVLRGVCAIRGERVL